MGVALGALGLASAMPGPGRTIEAAAPTGVLAARPCVDDAAGSPEAGVISGVPGSAQDLVADAAREVGAYGSAPAGRPWYQLRDRADQRGALLGYTLSSGVLDGGSTSEVDLPAEAFASGPSRGLVVLGGSDPSGSEVRVLAVGRGCTRLVARSDEVIRRAVLSADGRSLFAFILRRSDRHDLGVWRIDLEGGDRSRLLDPMDGPPVAGSGSGRTFSTELAWSLGGQSLAVQSCGELACRTRVLSLDTGASIDLGNRWQGQLIGLTDDGLVHYAACHGTPCPIVMTGLKGAARTTLALAAGRAVLLEGPAGPTLVYEDLDPGAPASLRSVVLASRRTGRVSDRIDPSRRLLPFESLAHARADLPRGWLMLTAEDGPRTGSLLVRLTDQGSEGAR